MYGLTHRETAEYVARYYKDRYGLLITGEEILDKYPWHEIVWEKFVAYAFYKVEGYYESWDNVPEPFEGMCVYIVTYELLEHYEYRSGRWCDLGSATASCWKV